MVTKELGLTPLAKFHSGCRQDALANLGAEEVEEMEKDAELISGCYYLNDGVLWSLEPQWFEPKKGFQTTNGLLEYLRSNPERFGVNADGFIYILEQLNKALVRANEENVRFRLLSNA